MTVLPRRLFVGQSNLLLSIKIQTFLSISNVEFLTLEFRRRLPVVMVKNRLAENIQTATKFVEQGHVRVGPEVIMDPAFLCSR